MAMSMSAASSEFPHCPGKQCTQGSVTIVNTPIIRFIFVSIDSLLGVEAVQQGYVSHAESTEVKLSTYSFSVEDAAVDSV
jgi:hypothetical protein